MTAKSNSKSWVSIHQPPEPFAALFRIEDLFRLLGVRLYFPKFIHEDRYSFLISFGYYVIDISHESGLDSLTVLFTTFSQ